jgi:hypothetical protein
MDQDRRLERIEVTLDRAVSDYLVRQFGNGVENKQSD